MSALSITTSVFERQLNRNKYSIGIKQWMVASSGQKSCNVRLVCQKLFSPRILQPHRQIKHRLHTRHMVHPVGHKVAQAFELKLLVVQEE